MIPKPYLETFRANMAAALGQEVCYVCIYCGSEWPELAERKGVQRDWLDNGLHWETIREARPDDHSPGIYAIATDCCKRRVMRRQYVEETDPVRALAQTRVARPGGVLS